MTDDEIRERALAHGFKLKEQPDGTMDLSPCVFNAIRACQPQWISVDERLPEISSSVLCIGVDGEGRLLAPVVATLREDGKFICGYRFEGGRTVGFYVETLPTHWMPLPAPPKGD